MGKKKQKLKRIASPYNLKETLGYFIRNFIGPSVKNKGIVEYIPSSYILNEGVIPKYNVAFIGDIMDMRGKSEIISENLKEFVRDCDYLIGNFEATITKAKGAYMCQKHIPQIMNALADLFPPEKTYLSMANNHAGDFGKEIFLESVDKLHSRGFNIFGWDDQPYWDINKDLRVTAATAWSNQKMDYVFMLKNAGQYVKKNVFNLLYPHFGYELELYPRPKTVEEGKKWIKKFDAIIGTHSHVPQAVTAVKSENNNGINKLIAYSLGDFCIEEKLKHYHYGIVLKIEIGQNNAGIWQIGLIEWHFTCCKSLSETECITTIVPKFPYLK